MPKSVHLCDWPQHDKEKINPKLEEEMERVKEIVSLALAERRKQGLKVRQPLNKLSVSPELQKGFRKAHRDLIKEEVNVKHLAVELKEKIKLDSRITPKLQEEGQLREIIRHIQEMRKKAGLKPQNKVSIHYVGSKKLESILTKNKKLILTTTKAKYLKKSERPKGKFNTIKEIKVDDEKLWLAIKRI